MQLKCVDNIRGDINLTVGKIYTVVSTTDLYYTVKDDTGAEGSFLKCRFVEVMDDPVHTAALALNRILESPATLGDLMQVMTQTSRTTKLDRRVRAVAYLIDNYTGGGMPMATTEQDCIDLITLIEQCRLNADQSAEATVALDRAAKRMSYILSKKQTAGPRCAACNEVMVNDNHVCTNRYSKAKDAAMTRDDTVREVT